MVQFISTNPLYFRLSFAQLSELICYIVQVRVDTYYFIRIVQYGIMNIGGTPDIYLASSIGEAMAKTRVHLTRDIAGGVAWGNVILRDFPVDGRSTMSPY